MNVLLVLLALAILGVGLVLGAAKLGRRERELAPRSEPRGIDAKFLAFGQRASLEKSTGNSAGTDRGAEDFAGYAEYTGR